MADFSSPAPRRTDQGLFANASPGLIKLMKRSRQELREKAREEYWTMKQQAAAADTSTGTGATPTPTGTEAV